MENTKIKNKKILAVLNGTAKIEHLDSTIDQVELPKTFVLIGARDGKEIKLAASCFVQGDTQVQKLHAKKAQTGYSKQYLDIFAARANDVAAGRELRWEQLTPSEKQQITNSRKK